MSIKTDLATRAHEITGDRIERNYLITNIVEDQAQRDKELKLAAKEGSAPDEKKASIEEHKKK